MLPKAFRNVHRRIVPSDRFLFCVLIAVTGYWMSSVVAFGQGEHAKSSVTNFAPDPCALLSSSEIEKVQGEGVADKKFSQQPGGGFVLRACFYQTPTFTESISLSIA